MPLILASHGACLTADGSPPPQLSALLEFLGVYEGSFLDSGRRNDGRVQKVPVTRVSDGDTAAVHVGLAWSR